MLKLCIAIQTYKCLTTAIVTTLPSASEAAAKSNKAIIHNKPFILDVELNFVDT